MPINVRQLKLDMLRQAEPILVRKVRPLIELDFKTKREQFFRAFESDPITQELEAGPSAFSSIPQIASSEGNLFSFLGFYADQRPVEALRRYLEKTIKLGRTKRGAIRGDRVIFSTPVSIPRLSDIDAAMAVDGDAKLEWTGRPFTNLIQRGIPGYPSYLFRLAPGPKNSRSGTAVQVESKLRGGSFSGAPYLGPLLAILKASINPRG